MKRPYIFRFLLTVVIIFCIFSFKNISSRGNHLNDQPKPDADNAGLILPTGFGALKVADNTVLKGLNENTQIDDEYFANPMPALNILKDQKIADILTYVRINFGNKASAVTVNEVKEARSKLK